MKWLISLVISLCLVTPAIGDSPYIAVVGNDSAANQFYTSSEYQQFMYDQTQLGVPVCNGTFPPVTMSTRVGGAGCEQFRSQFPLNQPEVCDTQGNSLSPSAHKDRGNVNVKVNYGGAGWFEWFVRLPMAPAGEINLLLECGVLQPEGYVFLRYDAARLAGAETGEKVGSGWGVVRFNNPGDNPLTLTALPKITAIAYPGPYNSFTPFHLTAFRNPGTYDPFNSTTKALVNEGAGQVLNGTDLGTRIVLKSCMDKTIVTKLPVAGQVNAMGEIEYDLAPGDIIYVRMDIPRYNTVDVYCHQQSLKVMGIGDNAF